MKICPSCNRSCYDTELYCPDCGKAIPTKLQCTYCSNIITDATAKHCDNCGGMLAFDRYPSHKGTIHCTACGKPRPVMSKYCTSCGIFHGHTAGQGTTLKFDTPAAVAPSKPASPTNTKKAAKIVIIVIIVLTVLFTALPILLSLGSFLLYAYEDDYDYDYDYDNSSYSSTIQKPSSDRYTRVDMDTLHEDIKSISEGDYVEVTGVIKERSQTGCTLVPQEFCLENSDNEVYVSWEYEDPEGEYIADYCTVGQVITIRGQVEYIYYSINELNLEGIEVLNKVTN